VILETTESSWHRFSRIQLPAGRRNGSRRSIAVYFYTRQRAGVETAPSHSTIYVPRPMGADLQPGYALQPEDVQELEVLIGRRDRQIRYLYERELDFSTTLAGILSFTLVSTRPHPDPATEVAARAVETQACYGIDSRSMRVMASD